MRPVFAYWDSSDLSRIRVFIEEWRARFPQFTVLGPSEIESLIARDWPEHVELFHAIRFPACRSDLARILALYDRGGLYIDCHCHLKDPAAVARLLTETLDTCELILYDKDRTAEPRLPDAYFPQTGVIFAQPHSPVLREWAAVAFDRLVEQRTRERESGFTPGYSIYDITGAAVLHELILQPDYRLKPPFESSFRFIGPGQQTEPIVYNLAAYYGYRTPGSHWHEREQVEPLFLDARPAGA
jgi:mannosyltransferase OCH1-like enzyme